MKLNRYGIDAFDRLTAQDHGPLVYYDDIEPLLPKWVACSERLPTQGDKYLVVVGKGDAAYVDADWWLASAGYWDKFAMSSVTHWMPLPPIPEPTP